MSKKLLSIAELYQLRDKLKQIKEVCDSEIELNAEQIELLTDGTEDFLSGRTEFALQILKFMEVK